MVSRVSSPRAHSQRDRAERIVEQDLLDVRCDANGRYVREILDAMLFEPRRKLLHRSGVRLTCVPVSDLRGKELDEASGRRLRSGKDCRQCLK